MYLIIVFVSLVFSLQVDYLLNDGKVSVFFVSAVGVLLVFCQGHDSLRDPIFIGLIERMM